jgi:hypothetical protein
MVGRKNRHVAVSLNGCILWWSPTMGKGSYRAGEVRHGPIKEEKAARVVLIEGAAMAVAGHNPAVAEVLRRPAVDERL